MARITPEPVSRSVEVACGLTLAALGTVMLGIEWLRYKVRPTR